MNKQEFEELVSPRLHLPLTDECWDIIQTVYTFHPAIPNVDGKKVIAKLYTTFGFAFIKAMLPQARQLEELQTEIARLDRELDSARDVLEFKLKECHRVYEAAANTLRQSYEQECIKISGTAKFGAIRDQQELLIARQHELEAREENTKC